MAQATREVGIKTQQKNLTIPERFLKFNIMLNSGSDESKNTYNDTRSNDFKG